MTSPAGGSNRPKRRVGRGIAGKGGKTAGRGTKGTGARDTCQPGFEGGQLPLTQRIPKLQGLQQPVPGRYALVNLDTLEAFAGDEATPTTLRAAGLVQQGCLVKVLGRGRAAPRRHGRGPRLLGVGPRGDRGSRRHRRVLPPPFGDGAPAGAGATRSPTASLGTLRDVVGSDAAGGAVLSSLKNIFKVA